MPEPIIQAVIEACARHYALDPQTIIGRDNGSSARIARATAMYVARLAGNFSYPEIGRAFHRDHKAALTACRQLSAKRAADPLFDKAIDGLVTESLGLGRAGIAVSIRKELLVLIQKKVALQIYGKNVEDVVDRILCEHFQRELVVGS